MPKIYRYLGIIIFFYSREHKPIHVHGRHGDNESKAELIIEDGVLIEIRISRVGNKEPLNKTQMKDFTIFVELYADKIIQKWTDYFVLNKRVYLEEINEKLER